MSRFVVLIIRIFDGLVVLYFLFLSLYLVIFYKIKIFFFKLVKFFGMFWGFGFCGVVWFLGIDS